MQEKQNTNALIIERGRAGGREEGGRAQQNKLLLLLLENDYP